MSEEIEEIKRRIDIVDLVSSYLKLKKVGTSYKALCPFHQETQPSFYVSPEKQIFKCFGCGKGGSIFDFIMEMEGLEFPEAVKFLAERAGVKLKKFEKEEYRKDQELKLRLYRLNRLAASFFHKILIGKPKAQFVRDYLEKRRISQESIERFFLGYAPASYDLLSNFLKTKGSSLLDAQQAGLVMPSEKKKGEYYDRFRDRLMFPICDLLGNVVGFSGRAMHETEAGKYINSPDTLIYSKSKLLYGLDKTKQAIKEKGEVIIVEGQMDLISLFQHGYQNVVAPCGTALTSFQLSILRRFTKTVAFAFDQDKAGQAATRRAIELAHQMGFEVKIIVIPFGKDPDECLRENPQLWEKAVAGQMNAVDYYFEKAKEKMGQKQDAFVKREIVQDLLPLIKNLGDSVLQAHYVQQLSLLVDVPEKFLYEALEKITSEREEPISEVAFPRPKVNIEERLVGLVLFMPEFQADFFNRINYQDFKDPKLQNLVLKLKEVYNQNVSFNLSSIKKRFPRLATTIDFLILPFESNPGEETLHREYQEYLARFLAAKNEKIQKEYEEKIKEAEAAGDRVKIKKLIREFQEKIIRKDGPTNK